jgi:Holliday junction DNA helicase RuvA
MIAHVKGALLEKQPTRLVVDVGGIGLEILVPLTTSQSVGEVGKTVSLHTVLVVREDSLTLYGFNNPEQRSLFLKLIGVSGIGPKIALGALSGPPLEELVAALRGQDLVLLTRLPGIGKKTAARMSLELKDSLAEFEAEAPAGAADQVQADAVDALISLGYTRAAATDAVANGAKGEGEELDVGELVRGALTRLGGGRKR